VAVLNDVTSTTGPVTDEIRDFINASFWIWFYNNKNTSIPIKIWKISINVKIEQFHGLFVLLFGEDSAATYG
jgi:hypothetical protein